VRGGCGERQGHTVSCKRKMHAAQLKIGHRTGVSCSHCHCRCVDLLLLLPYLRMLVQTESCSCSGTSGCQHSESTCAAGYAGQHSAYAQPFKPVVGPDTRRIDVVWQAGPQKLPWGARLPAPPHTCAIALVTAARAAAATAKGLGYTEQPCMA
jgi:hypothetical protein